MSTTVWQVHRFWVVRAALVLIVTVLAEAAVAAWLPQPARWATLVAGTLPVTLFFFVAWPLIRKEDGKPS